MIALIHRRCGAVAYYYDHMPEHAEVMSSGLATTVDGSEVPVGSALVCPFCHDRLMSWRDLRAKDLSDG